MPSQPLFRTTTTTGRSSATAAASSCAVMAKDPSPSTQTTVASGRAARAPIAAGSPNPMVPRPPELTNRRGAVQTRYCMAHI
jgi:hypothetical protein